MTLTRYEPYNLIDQFHNEINRLFNTNPGSAAATPTSWVPAVDILEEEHRYVLRADVPGVERKDIDITLEDTVLTIKGERRVYSEEGRQAYRRRERGNGIFFRQFTLPDSVDAANISAKVSDGVLEIGIPKQTKLAPQKITVN